MCNHLGAMRQRDRDSTGGITLWQNVYNGIWQWLILGLANWMVLITGPRANSVEFRTVTNNWSVSISGFCDSSAAIADDGTIYFGTYDGALFALRANGTRKWVFKAGREIRSSPAVSTNGAIYFGCRNRKCYCLDPGGKKNWEFNTGGWVDSSPALGSDGTVYFGSWDRSLYAVNSEGTKKWAFPTGGPIVSSPAIDVEGRIYFGSHDGKFYALDRGGTKLWEYATGGPILSSPAIDKDGTLYITSVEGALYGLNPGGALKWRLKTGGITESSPVVGRDGSIYVGVNHKLWAVSAEGKERWQAVLAGGGDEPPIQGTPALLADGSVSVIASYGMLTAIDQERHPLWRFTLGAQGHASPSVGPDGTIYIGGQVNAVGNFFYAVSASVPLDISPWPKFRRNRRNTGNAADVDR
jgi:outer membrane protein assembly factor BamB